MIGGKENQRKATTLLSLILAGEAIFFLPFILPRVFRPTMLTVFEITNTQLGSFFSVYGLIAMISYLFGGQLADRFSARKLMAIALWLTAAGGLVMSFVPSPIWIYLIYGLWGFSTIFLFWAALIRATREWGGDGYQGRAFGWLEGGRGIVGAILATFTWLIFAQLTPDIIDLAEPEAFFNPYQVVILITSFLTALTGWLVWVRVPDNEEKLRRDPPSEVLRKVGKLIRMPRVWLLSIIIICAYSGYKITDDFSLYAREVFGFSEVGAAGIGVASFWLRGLVAISAGVLADRFMKVRLINIFFAIIMFGSLLTGTGIIEFSMLLTLLNMTALAAGIYALRALYFAVLKEAGIPLSLTGTAVGIASFLGYTPEVFMGPWMGYLLDNHPGASGHQYVFLVLAGFSLAGLVSGLLFSKFSYP